MAFSNRLALVVALLPAFVCLSTDAWADPSFGSGATITPASVVTATASAPVPGATIRTFDLPGGMTSVSVTPPAGFSLSTATAAQRSYLGIPTEVSSQLLQGAHFGQPIEELQVGPPATPAETIDSYNWSGIVAPQTSSTYWAASLSDFYEPTPNFATCAKVDGFEYAYYWTGIGGVGNDDLAQNGSGNAAYGKGPSYGNTTFYWYENWNYEPGSEILENGSGVAIPVTQGDLQIIETVADGLLTTGAYAGDYAFTYWWEDDTTHTVYDMPNYVPAADWTPQDETAEFIVELPGDGTEGTNNMVNYGSVDNILNAALKAGSSTWTLLTDNSEGYDLWQLDTPDQVSTASDPGTGGDGITTSWGPHCN
jgi:hypothetical protein